MYENILDLIFIFFCCVWLIGATVLMAAALIYALAHLEVSEQTEEYRLGEREETIYEQTIAMWNEERMEKWTEDFREEHGRDPSFWESLFDSPRRLR